MTCRFDWQCHRSGWLMLPGSPGLGHDMWAVGNHLDQGDNIGFDLTRLFLTSAARHLSLQECLVIIKIEMVNLVMGSWRLWSGPQDLGAAAEPESWMHQCSMARVANRMLVVCCLSCFPLVRELASWPSALPSCAIAFHH